VATTGIGLGAGVGWKQALFEGAAAFAISAGGLYAYESYNAGTLSLLASGKSGSGISIGMGVPLGNSSDNTSPRVPQGENFPNKELHKTTENVLPKTVELLDEFVRMKSDRAGFDDNFGNGAGTPAYWEMFASTVNANNPKITPEELTGKTPSEIRKMANDKGLKPFGDPNINYPRKWNDPLSNKQRIRIDSAHYENGKSYDLPSAAKPHVHGYDETGKPIRDAFGDKHFPLASEIESLAIGIASRIFVGVTFLLYPQNAY